MTHKITQQVPNQAMRVGINTAWLTTYGGVPFANLLYNFGTWSRVSGTGSIVSQEQGALVLTGASSTDIYRLAGIPAPGTPLKTGTYTVLNPDGLKIGIGSFAGVTYAPYNTATSFTFTAGDVSNGLYLFYQGSGGVTNINGPVCLIIPGQAAAYAAGDVFAPDFITYMKTLAPRQIRFMDAQNTNSSLITDWADRTRPSSITFNTQSSGRIWPHEHIIGLCNRLGVDPWVSYPARGTIGISTDTTTYAYNMATLYKNTLNPGLQLQLEYVNEIWNTANAFLENSNWVTLLNFTKYIAAATPSTNSYNLPAHGLTDTQHVYCFTTKENAPIGYGAQPAQMSYQIGYGGECIVSVIDSDNFQLKSTIDGSIIQVATRQVNLMFARTNEAGALPSNANDTNYSMQLIRLWNVFDAVMGLGRYVHRVGSQGGNTSVTARRFATLTSQGAAGRADRCHVAPYFNGMWWVARSTPAVNQITPAVWTSQSSSVVHSLYLASATPSDADIIAGTNAIATETITSNSMNTASYVSFTPIAGLTDGTAYKSYYAFISSNTTPIIRAAVQSGAGSVTYFYDTTDGTLNGNFTQMAQRARISLSGNATNTSNGLPAHAALIPSTCVMDVYECGFDMVVTNSSNGPPEQSLFVNKYLVSPEAGQLVTAHYKALASGGARSANYYADVLGSVYNLSTNPSTYANVTDPKFVALSAFKGLVNNNGLMSASSLSSIVPKQLPTMFPDITPPDIVAMPTYPSIVSALPSGFTYSIINGNSAVNYDVNSGNLRIIAGNGIDYTKPFKQSVRLEATDGNTYAYFNANFFTGASWFPSNALWAASPFDATDIATSGVMAAEAGFGTSLPQLSATPAAYAAGLNDMTNAIYYNTAAMTAAMVSTKPILIAMVLDRFNQTSGSIQLVTFSIGANAISFGFSAVQNAPRWQVQLNGSQLVTVNTMNTGNSNWASGQKHVHWILVDAPNQKVYSGYDQTTTVNGSALALPTTTGWSRAICVGNDAGTTARGALSKMKHGAFTVVNDATLTPTSILPIIQKMQNLYGI